uniref:Lipoprotein n=1 Tax=Burkholderia phage vB_BgluM-SURPRISE13 TaxID=3159457 RepID=A0AAU7PFG9_9VIRU
MKKNFLLIAMIAAVGLSGCAGNIQYRDKYAIMTPNDNLLQDNTVPPPPATSVEYSKLTCDAKEDMLTSYINDLLGVIGKDRADKAGLREWKAEVAKKVDELNKKATSNGSSSN